MGYLGVVILLVISLSIHYADSVLCKICTEGYEDLTRCTKVGKCGAGSICYTEVNYDDSGRKIIYSGCKSKKECTDLGLISKRKKRDYQLCASCCDTDFCNTAVCGLAAPPGVVECLSCTNTNSLDECGTTQLCSVGDYCMTEYRYIGNGRAAYKMGCESSEICKLRDQYVKNFSRRAEPRGGMAHPMRLQLDQGREQARRHEQMAQGREQQAHRHEQTAAMTKRGQWGDVKRQIADAYAICLSCCDYSFCNLMENCHYKQEAPPYNVVSG